METFSIDCSKIKVRDGLDRFRKDYGDIKSLSDSINRVGQILPIVVNRDHELIDGGRRLAACVSLGVNALCVYADAVEPEVMRELEIEANLHRKDFTPAEYAAAVKALHELKITKHGAKRRGPTDKDAVDTGWTIGDTAKAIGKAKSTVINVLEQAELVEQFPQLKEAKTAREINKIGRKLQIIGDVMTRVSMLEADPNNIDEKLPVLLKRSSLEALKDLPDNSYDIVITDPPYAIDYENLNQTKTAAGTATAVSFSDSRDLLQIIHPVLSEELFRVTTEYAHLYLFVGPEHFWDLRKIYQAAGWLVHVKPIIWIKKQTGQTTAPHAWPASCYEMILYARKQNSTLVKEGMPDFIECSTLSPTNRIHPTEKPIDLIRNLIQRSAFSGQSLLDCFVGSGAVLEAAYMEGLYSCGYEISDEIFSLARNRLSRCAEDNE